MQDHKMIKCAKLVAVVTMAIFTVSFLARQETGASAIEEPAQGRIDIVGQGVPLNERIKSDDGVSFVIHFSGDTHGNLDSCG